MKMKPIHSLFNFIFCTFALDFTDGIGAVSTENIIRTSIGISLTDYWSECSNRPSCGSINFHQSAHVCILKNDYSEGSKHDPQPGFVYRQKSSMEPVQCGSSTCQVGETCNTATNLCEIRECPPLLETSHVKVLGNLWSVGSKAILKCERGYIPSVGTKLSVTTVCEDKGDWSEGLTCVPEPPPTPSYPAFSCPPDDTIFRTVQLSNGNLFTYRVFKTKVMQSVAKQNCMREGGYLARVTTLEEMNTLLSLTKCPGYGLEDYYVDGSNADSPSWIMSNGDQVPMTQGPNGFWNPGTPDNPDNHHCLRMRKDAAYYWDDYDCSFTYFYVCEK